VLGVAEIGIEIVPVALPPPGFEMTGCRPDRSVRFRLPLVAQSAGLVARLPPGARTRRTPRRPLIAIALARKRYLAVAPSRRWRPPR